MLVNVFAPLYCRKPDGKFAETLKQTEFTSDTPGGERIRCIDDNEEALLWRLRMIGAAKKSIVLATFDLRADESGTDLLAALNHAAEKGVEIKLLIDGIYQQLFLNGSKEFQALAARENVEVGVYNPVSPVGIFKLNYRMHDKYVIVDDKMYLLGGRNSNDIFLGDYTTDVNVDRDILVCDTTNGKGESLQELEAYFQQIWNEDCVKIKGGRKKNSSEISVSEEAADDSEGTESNLKNPDIVNGKSNAENEITDETQERLSKYEKQYQSLEMRYASLKEKYTDIEDYSSWQEDTIPANKITLVNNGTHAGPKTPLVLQTIRYLAQNADNVTIQTPYVICNGYMYDTLNEIAFHARLKIILNAVEKGSNPWGCTDYLNQKKKILNTGADVYELMNEVPVHTKAVLLDDRLSVVGSYNLDMRSTYLDTELMLVIDSKELNQQIQSTESTYIEKSKEVLSNGQETEGAQYETKVLNWQKKLFYGVLRIIIRPLRQLL
ncbi:MAG: phospholipase D-like domain-containing protein [Blautia faecis]